jgi:hypothetical protein
MRPNAEVVDQEAGRLPLCGAVDAGDGLQEFGVLDEAVEVEHLLDGASKPVKSMVRTCRKVTGLDCFPAGPSDFLKSAITASWRALSLHRAQAGSSLLLPEMTGTKSRMRMRPSAAEREPRPAFAGRGGRYQDCRQLRR